MLTPVEARALALNLQTWPPGLGFALEPASNKRGWRAVPGYRPFYPPPEGARLCPVAELHETRRGGVLQHNYYGQHLQAFYDIRDSLAWLLDETPEDAHQLYNHLLRNEPGWLAEALNIYADECERRGFTTTG